MAGGLFALTDFATKFILGRGYQRQLYKHQIAQHQMAIDNAQRSLQQFDQDKVYNRAVMGQSFAARGISNSTIATQGTANFDATAARRDAALSQNLAFQQQGLSLLKTYHKYQQRMLIYNGIRSALETVVSAYSGMSGGGFGDVGQEDNTQDSSDPSAMGSGGGGNGVDAWDSYTGQPSDYGQQSPDYASSPGYDSMGGGYGGGSFGGDYGGGGSDYGGGESD